MSKPWRWPESTIRSLPKFIIVRRQWINRSYRERWSSISWRNVTFKKINYIRWLIKMYRDLCCKKKTSKHIIINYINSGFNLLRHSPFLKLQTLSRIVTIDWNISGTYFVGDSEQLPCRILLDCIIFFSNRFSFSEGRTYRNGRDLGVMVDVGRGKCTCVKNCCRSHCCWRNLCGVIRRITSTQLLWKHY